MRAVPGPTTRRRHKKVIKLAKGYKWGRKNIYSIARRAVMKAGLNAYIGRKQKKRAFRSLWISRLNAAVKPHGMKYSEFIYKLTRKRVEIDRKMLSNLAIQDPEVFKEIVELARS